MSMMVILPCYPLCNRYLTTDKERHIPIGCLSTRKPRLPVRLYPTGDYACIEIFALLTCRKLSPDKTIVTDQLIGDA